MFEVPTVLVLGAGASVHYGYPTGDKLIEDIKDTISNKTFTDSQGRGDVFKLSSDKDCNDLLKKLEFFDPLSIDSFLGQHKSNAYLVDAGKQMIAYEILRNEDQKKLNSSYRSVDSSSGKEQRGNWYRFLLNAMFSIPIGRQFSDVISNLADPNKPLNLYIVTFNYDISLEYFFSSRIYGASFLEDSQKRIIWEKLAKNIVHIYGQIGGLSRIYDTYGVYANVPIRALHQADTWKDTIKVIGEERGEQVELNVNKAKTWLKEARNVLFLGYGFNNDNNVLLDLADSCKKTKSIFLTNYGNSPRVSKKSRELFGICDAVSHKRDAIDVYHTVKRENDALQISTQGVYQALEHEFPLI